ncbi:MAG: hypothetical protein N2554_11155 [Fimbriimonadales bacterium]|nr:hypothetical protein [Fimbriimonadales bacterium]
MRYTEYDFKFAKTILQQHFPEQFEDIQGAIAQLDTRLGRAVRPTPAKLLAKLLRQRGWQHEQHPTPECPQLRFDLQKERVAVEIQMSDRADCYNDFLKFLLAYNQGSIDVGVEIVYDDTVNGRNIPRISVVKRDLETYRQIFACPIWLIGLKESD